MKVEGRKDERKVDAQAVSHNSSLAPSSLGEFDFISRIRRRALRQGKTRGSLSSLIAYPSSLTLGIGDDAAVIQQSSGRETVITADLLIEDIDFRRDWTPAPLLGHRALAVSLSDIAAMGARPLWAMLSLGVPRDIWRSRFIDQFYEGFFALADHYGVTLIGGDVSRTPDRVVIDSIVLGEAASGMAVRRAGARPGDHIFVTGALGGAAAGLRLLERGTRLDNQETGQRLSSEVEELLTRHLCPLPRTVWGVMLGHERLATAMVDLSDGLSSDLAHLCEESNVGAVVEAARIPVDPRVTEICGRRALDPLLLALHGGEDFELLFTVRPRGLPRLPKRIDGVPITYIGDITSEAGRITLVEGSHRSALRPEGFDHFKYSHER